MIALLATVTILSFSYFRMELESETYARDKEAARRAARSGLRQATAALRAYASDRAVFAPDWWPAGGASYPSGSTYEGGTDACVLQAVDAASRVYANGVRTASGRRLVANLAEIVSLDAAKGDAAATALVSGPAAKAFYATEDELRTALKAADASVVLADDQIDSFIANASLVAWHDPNALPFADEAAYKDLATTLDPSLTPLFPGLSTFPTIAALRAGILPGRAAPADWRGTPREARAPVNVNLASKEVLQALLMGLSACVFHRGVGNAATGPAQATFDDLPEVTAPIPRDLAGRIANEIISRRASSPFRDFADFESFLGGLVGNPSVGLSAIGAETIAAALDPSPIPDKWNPDADVARVVDKSDVISGTTDSCFGPPGVFRIESRGTILDASAGLHASAALVAYVRAFETYHLSTQRDLKAGATFAKTASFPEAGFETDASLGSTVAGGVGLAAREVAGASRLATHADDATAGGTAPSGTPADALSIPARIGTDAWFGEPKKLTYAVGGGSQTILQGRTAGAGTDSLRDGLFLNDAIAGNGASGPHLGTFAAWPALPDSGTLEFWWKPAWPNPPTRDRVILESRFCRIRTTAAGAWEIDTSWEEDAATPPPKPQGDSTAAIPALSGAAGEWQHAAIAWESGAPSRKLMLYANGGLVGTFPPEANRYLIALRTAGTGITVFGGRQNAGGAVGRAREENIGATVDRVRLTPGLLSFGAAPERYEASGTWTRACAEAKAGVRVGTVHADVRGAGGTVLVEASPDGTAWTVVRPADGSDPPAPQDFAPAAADGAFRVRATLAAPAGAIRTPFLRAVRLTVLSPAETILCWEAP